MTGTRIASLGISAALAGCASLSGYEASNQFACKAPVGVLCESMSGVYANAEQGNLPGQRIGLPKTPAQFDPPPAKDAGVARALARPLTSGTPIRSAPRVLRVWFAPWEDSDGDLHDQQFVYLQVDSGRWLLEHNRRRIMDAYRPVRPPTTKTSAPGAAPAGPPTARTGDGQPQGQEAIGVMQQRPGEPDASAMFSGIRTPGAPDGSLPGDEAPSR